jgi:hypothetical protein
MIDYDVVESSARESCWSIDEIGENVTTVLDCSSTTTCSHDINEYRTLATLTFTLNCNQSVSLTRLRPLSLDCCRMHHISRRHHIYELAIALGGLLLPGFTTQPSLQLCFWQVVARRSKLAHHLCKRLFELVRGTVVATKRRRIGSYLDVPSRHSHANVRVWMPQLVNAVDGHHVDGST